MGGRRSFCVARQIPGAVLARAGSRYGPLAGFEVALSRGAPFALIAKPCDAGAIRTRTKVDPRIDHLVVAVLVMVCSGALELGKSQAVLEDRGIVKAEVTLYRYRGFGNPGPTRVETHGQDAMELNYLDMWADEGSWHLQSRCKICPDAIGEAADIAAAESGRAGHQRARMQAL